MGGTQPYRTGHNEPLDSLKVSEFLNHMSDCKLLRKPKPGPWIRHGTGFCAFWLSCWQPGRILFTSLLRSTCLDWSLRYSSRHKYTNHFTCSPCSLYWQSRGISVTIGSRLRAGWPGFYSRRGQWHFFSSPSRPDRLWGPPSLLSNGCWGSFPGG